MEKILKRSEMSYLVDWSGQVRRKPLVIRGARQTGKSTLVREFARTMSFSLVEINFERNPEFIKAFSVMDPKQVLATLSLMTEQTIRAGSSLLFLDEIQAAPAALSSLRYFYEEIPALHVVAAGSLLEFSLADARFPMPVGRVEYLHLGPMQFEDFLEGLGHSNLVSHIRNLSLETLHKDAIPEAVHEKCLGLLSQYWVVGGLPEAVARYAQSGDFREVSRVQQSIIATYRDDFNKYSHGNLKERVQLVFDQLPAQVGKKLKYTRISPDHRAAELAGALQQLCMAKIAYKVHHSAANGIPLGAEANERRFKILCMDVGLMCATLNLNILDLTGKDLTFVNNGALAEQFIGQHLLYAGAYYETPSLYYWAREARNAAAEIDYLVTSGQQVIPVEIKAGSTGSLKSLHQFLKEKRRVLGLRFNADVAGGLSKHSTKLTDKTPVRYRLLSLPLYLVGQTRRLVKSCIQDVE